MTDAQFKDLDRFVSYAEKQFDLPLLAGCFADGRADPEVPSRAVGLSLLLGEVAQIPSLSAVRRRNQVAPMATVGGLPRAASATIPLAMPATG